MSWSLWMSPRSPGTRGEGCPFMSPPSGPTAVRPPGVSEYRCTGLWGCPPPPNPRPRAALEADTPAWYPPRRLPLADRQPQSSSSRSRTPSPARPHQGQRRGSRAQHSPARTPAPPGGSRPGLRPPPRPSRRAPAARGAVPARLQLLNGPAPPLP